MTSSPEYLLNATYRLADTRCATLSSTVTVPGRLIVRFRFRTPNGSDARGRDAESDARVGDDASWHGRAGPCASRCSGSADLPRAAAGFTLIRWEADRCRVACDLDEKHELALLRASEAGQRRTYGPAPVFRSGRAPRRERPSGFPIRGKRISRAIAFVIRSHPPARAHEQRAGPRGFGFLFRWRMPRRWERSRPS